MLGFEALEITASAVKVGSRKKEKVNKPIELEKILLGCYIKLGPGSQESCVYLGIERLQCGKPMNWNFGIKSIYPKIGGACVYTKILEKSTETQRLPRLCQSRSRLHKN